MLHDTAFSLYIWFLDVLIGNLTLETILLFVESIEVNNTFISSGPSFHVVSIDHEVLLLSCLFLLNEASVKEFPFFSMTQKILLFQLVDFAPVSIELPLFDVSGPIQHINIKALLHFLLFLTEIHHPLNFLEEFGLLIVFEEVCAHVVE